MKKVQLYRKYNLLYFVNYQFIQLKIFYCRKLQINKIMVLIVWLKESAESAIQSQQNRIKLILNQIMFLDLTLFK